MTKQIFSLIFLIVLLFVFVHLMEKFIHVGDKNKRTINIHTFKNINIENKQTELFNEQFHAGMNILLYGSQNLSNAEHVFSTLKELGVNSVGLNFPLVQEHWQSNQIKISPSITPPVADLEAIIDMAHSFGFHVMLRPIIDESQLMKTGHWRGDIQPEDPQIWFQNYRDILISYASLARSKQIEIFNIGTELSSLQSQYRKEWESMIREIRNIYKGDLMYSFNWNTIHDIPNIEFVHMIDYVGIDAYFPLDVPNDASVEELESAWGKWVEEVKNVGIDKKIIITEAGIVPVEGAYRTPYVWEYNNQPYSPKTQENYYIATFNSWKPSIQGIYWWVVSLEEDNIDINYSPFGLPTEEVIKKQFKET